MAARPIDDKRDQLSEPSFVHDHHGGTDHNRLCHSIMLSHKPFSVLFQVVNPRSALLSNFEVLTLLRELESDHLAQAKTALRVKKEDEEAGRPLSNYVSSEQVCENLRTVEVEVARATAAPSVHAD